MTRLRMFIIIILILAVVAVGVVVWLVQNAPQTTTIDVAEFTPEATGPRCLTDDAGRCLTLPQVTGTNLKNEPVSLPDVFSTDLNFVVIPFDRDQQVRAIDWVSPARELAETYPELRYYSVAALPDLALGTRLLIVGGMTAAIQDEAIQTVSILLFLEDQALFLETLAIPDTEQIVVFLFNQQGEALWRSSGDYSESGGDALRTAVADILGE